jgi:isocitrate/isopropylmalate dehydrogenase
MYRFGDCSFPFGGASGNMSTCGWCACYKALESPVKGFPPGEIDFCIVRENNEGEYSEVGGRLNHNTNDAARV